MANHEECRAYISQLESEHERINRMLKQLLNSRWRGSEEGILPWLGRISGELQRIGIELAEHFRQEEEGGCLEEAATRRPSLAAEELRLEREHPMILAALASLMEKIQREKNEPATELERAIAEEIGSFVRLIEVHEGAEEKLLERGFNLPPRPDRESADCNITEDAALWEPPPPTAPSPDAYTI